MFFSKVSELLRSQKAHTSSEASNAVGFSVHLHVEVEDHFERTAYCAIDLDADGAVLLRL